MSDIKQQKKKMKKKKKVKAVQESSEASLDEVSTTPMQIEEPVPKKKKKRKASAIETQETSAVKTKKKKKKKKITQDESATEVPEKKTKKKKKTQKTETQEADTKTKSAEDDDNKFLGMKRAERPDPRLGQSRIFLGNLSFKIDETLLRATFEPCGEIESIHWVLDKGTGKFYGTAFVEFIEAASAQEALKLDSKKVLGRPMKVKWATGGGKGGSNNNRAGPSQIKAAPISEKPEGCTTVFLGNLPYDVDEEAVKTFFQDCGEITDVRWVMRDEEFKGAGFVEFAVTEATDLAVKLNGNQLGSRTIRVDYAPHRPGRG